MVAVDTNVVVRFLVRDDLKQAARSASLIHDGSVWVSKTVFLETEWVLRSLYRLAPEAIAGALQAFAGLPNVVLEDELSVAKALDWFKAGLDFADALHLASAGKATRFATFDRKLARRAQPLTAVEIAAL